MIEEDAEIDAATFARNHELHNEDGAFDLLTDGYMGCYYDHVYQKQSLASSQTEVSDYWIIELWELLIGNEGLPPTFDRFKNIVKYTQSHHTQISDERIDKMAKERFPSDRWSEHHRDVWKLGMKAAFKELNKNN